MSSKYSTKSSKGPIQIHENGSNILSALTAEQVDETSTKSAENSGSTLPQNSQAKPSTPSRQHPRRPWSTATSSYRSLSADSRNYGKMDPQSLIGHTLKLQDWLSQKNVKSVQEKADIEAKATKELYSSILDTEDTFVKDIDDYLQYKDGLDLRKKELLHKRWNENVHEPIRTQVLTVMDGPDYPALVKRKRQLYKEFLEYTNKKGHSFLDTYPPGEYFPFAVYPRTYHMKAAPQKLRDPLLSQERARTAEDRTILRCMTGNVYSDKDIEQVRLPPLPLVPLGRHGTECKTWLAMPLTDIESPVRMASRSEADLKWNRMKSDLNASHFSFEDWGANVDQRIVDRELNLQKRKACESHPPLNYTEMTKHMTLTPQEGVLDMPIVPQQSIPCNHFPLSSA